MSAPPGYPYGSTPGYAPYGSPYGAAPPYGQPPPSDKPGKNQPYADPYAAAADPYGKPAKNQQPGAGYADPYAKPAKNQQPGASGYSPSAPPAASPYGAYADPYAKPDKPAKNQGYADPYAAAADPYAKPGKNQGYADPYVAAADPYAKPGKNQQPGAGYADPYGKPAKPQGYGDPYGATDPYAKPGKVQQGGPPPQGGYGGAPYGSSPFAALVPSAFPPGTDPNVVACFQAADHDGSGFIDDKELQGALSNYNQSFSLRTVHLLMYLFTSTNVRKIGPKEFASVFYSLQSWRGIFDRADRDRSGKIDVSELRDSLLSLGFAVSPGVLDLLVSKYDKSGGQNRAIEYDAFIECCLTVKGLTEKFKEKDVGFRGSATFSYEDFMLTVLPFLIA